MTQRIVNYLISVTAACLIGVIVNALVRQETVRRIARFASGLLLILTVVLPLLPIEAEDISSLFSSYAVQYDTSQLKEQWHERLSAHIKETSETYIEQKADELGVFVRADVTLDDEEYPQPIAVRITGILSYETKNRLSDYIETALGVKKEAQEWNYYAIDE